MIGDNHVQFGGGRSAERRSRPTLLFFMVKNLYIFNFKSQFACAFSSVTPLSVDKVKIGKINDDRNNALTIGNNNNQDNKDPENSKDKYVKVLVHDPFNNRDIILKVTKKQKGVISTLFFLVLSFLVLSIVFSLYLVVNSLFSIDFIIGIFTSSSALSLQCAVIPLLVYDNAESQRKEIIIDNSKKSGVYRWINKVNGKCYVGSSVNLGYRLKQYYSYKYLTREKSISSISSALIKYGHSNFILEILEHCEPEKSIILEKEQFYINMIKPEYNILKIAGSPLGYKHTEEALAKMRNRKLSQEHLEQVLTRILSEEHKSKVREANLGRKNSEESIEKMRNRVITDEVRAKLSQNITKYNLSKAHEVEVVNVKENTKTVYESVRKAAVSLNTSHVTLSAFIKSGNLYKGLYKIIKNQ